MVLNLGDVDSLEGGEALQGDLYKPEGWAITNCLNFNKCMCYSAPEQSSSVYMYRLGDPWLESGPTERLVQADSKLNVSQYYPFQLRIFYDFSEIIDMILRENLKQQKKKLTYNGFPKMSYTSLLVLEDGRPVQECVLSAGTTECHNQLLKDLYLIMI